MAKTNDQTQAWAAALHQTLCGLGVSQVAYVPDAGHTRLIQLFSHEQSVHNVALTSEEEGVAMLCGGWLGGERGVLLMQSSGVGNCINMLAMVHECRFPLLMLVTMRGEWGEFNPWQVPMGQSAGAVLNDIGVIVERVDEAERLADTVHACGRLAFDSERAVAVLIGQRVIGFKTW